MSIVEDFSDTKADPNDIEGTTAEGNIQFFELQVTSDTDNNIIMLSQAGQRLQSYRGTCLDSFYPAKFHLMLFDSSTGELLEKLSSQKFDNFLFQKKNLKKGDKYTLCVSCQW